MVTKLEVEQLVRLVCKDFADLIIDNPTPPESLRYMALIGAVSVCFCYGEYSKNSLCYVTIYEGSMLISSWCPTNEKRLAGDNPYEPKSTMIKFSLGDPDLVEKANKSLLSRLCGIS